MKKLALILGIIISLVIIFFAFNNYIYKQKQGPGDPIDYKKINFIIDDSLATLGETPGIEYFGNEAAGDLNNDGQDDVAFLITQNKGGSGTFFYIVVALKTTTGYQGTNAQLLGDRIAPQTTEIKNETLIVNYADRKPDESMVTQPSVGVSKYFKIMEDRLTEYQEQI